MAEIVVDVVLAEILQMLGELLAVTIENATSRTFLETPLVEYTVTEGLLLCILLVAVLKPVFGFVWRCFDGF